MRCPAERQAAVRRRKTQPRRFSLLRVRPLTGRLRGRDAAYGRMARAARFRPPGGEMLEGAARSEAMVPRGGIEPPTLRFSVALQRGITIWSRSKIFLEVFFSKTPASPERPAAERHPRTQRINCARPDAQRTGEGLDGKAIYFNALKKRVCMECTRPFYFSLLFVRAPGIDFCRQAAMRWPIAVPWSRTRDRRRMDIRLYDSEPCQGWGRGFESLRPLQNSR